MKTILQFIHTPNQLWITNKIVEIIRFKRKTDSVIILMRLLSKTQAKEADIICREKRMKKDPVSPELKKCKMI